MTTLLAGYAQNFLDTGLATESFYKAVYLHGNHALFYSLVLDCGAGGVTDDQLLNLGCAGQYFVNADPPFIATGVALITAAHVRAPESGDAMNVSAKFLYVFAYVLLQGFLFQLVNVPIACLVVDSKYLLDPSDTLLLRAI